MSKFVLLVAAICCCQLASSFNLERDFLGKVRTKRQIKKLCGGDFYSAPLNAVCTIPASLTHAAAGTKCAAAQKVKTLADSEIVCAMDCVYQASKWVSTAGVLDEKKITADLNKGMDATWGKIVSTNVAACLKIAKTTGPLKSGYVTKCKPSAHVFQACLALNLFKQCPPAKQSKTYAVGMNALKVCDPQMIYKTPAEIEKFSKDALKTVDTKAVGGAISAAVKDPKALMAMAAAKGLKLPGGIDMSKINPAMLAAAQKDPSAAMKSLPAGVNPSMFASFLG